MITIRELAQALHEARVEDTKRKGILQEAREAWERHNSMLFDDADRAKKRLAFVDDALRVFALAEYEATKNKALGSGVNIRVETRLGYDPVTALLWAKKHDMALIPESLDKKAFEGLAKAHIPPLDFVKQVEVATVTVAQDLEKALLEAQP